MSTPLKVLLVEDNPLDADLLFRELRRAGLTFVCDRVDTEKDFRALLRTERDIVLSDYELPQFNGLRALEILQESGLDLPFILISGTIGEDLAVKAMQQGASDYLMKDRLGRLGPAILHAIEEKRLQREGRRADQLLREHAAFVHDVLNSLRAAVVVLDEQGVVKATNEAWRRFTREGGLPEGLNENYLTVYLADGAETTAPAEQMRQARAGVGSVLRGERSEFGMEFARHLGTGVRWYLLRVAPLGGGHGGAVVAHEDITALKEAELTVRASEERFRRLIENASDMIVVVNDQGYIEFISPSAKSMIGLPPELLIGQSAISFIHEEDQAAALASLARLLDDPDRSRAVEFRVRHRDGSWRVLQSVGKSMTGARGEPLIVINSRDVTETQKLEEQFLRAQRLEAIGTLSSGIAHDLNNILAPMLMVAPLLRDKLPEAQDVELLTMIESAAQRGASVIRQLLTFSRGVEGKRLPVQPRYLLKEMLSIMRETFPREITVVERVPAELWPIVADATQIHQVLLNLCVNARDAMRRGGSLTLEARNVTLREEDMETLAPLQAGPYVCVAVADTGEGIARENLNRIFEPFFTTKEVGKGTGLGLSTVMGIVKSHGGLVSVQSELGHGTTFQIYLPAMVGAEQAEAASHPADTRGAKELVLVVDDEEAIRRALRAMLEEQNYRVLEAGDGREALRLFMEHRDAVRLVLTDIMMPEMNGVALIRALRSIAPEQPILATSGMHDDVRVQELAELGVGTVIAKPCAATDILAAVREAVGRAGAN